MTIRLYYDDSYRSRFQARIVERMLVDNQLAIILDRTLFYPTSGGQPHDTGTIDGVEVVDVQARESDQEIIHVLNGEIDSNSIEGTINWQRRFDHMQQHTGQHILSQAFIQVAGLPTVSFHLGSDSCTIDLMASDVSQEVSEAAELLANQVIWENRSVESQMIERNSLDSKTIRKVPKIAGDQYRLIEIDDFDSCACGGTHVSRTGEVGMIKVVKIEHQGSDIRVGFHCGQRALKDYDYKNRILARLSKELTTGISDLEYAINGMREDVKVNRQQLKKQSKKLVQFEAKELLSTSTQLDDVSIVCRAFRNRNLDEIRLLANQIAQSSGNVAMLGLASDKSQLVFASSRNLPLQMNLILEKTLPLLGQATGGGSATFAQGGGTRTTQKELQNILNEALGFVQKALATNEIHVRQE